MPFQNDAGRPVRTVDTQGNTISTNTNEAAPIKHQDTAGRTIEKSEQTVQESIKQDANNAAQQALGFFQGKEEPKQTQQLKVEENTETKQEQITSEQVRKEYLEAQRIKREANEMNKKAKANLEKASAFEKAKALAENGEDPTALLKAAGLDPVKFYRDMTKYALSDKGKQEEVDPVKKQLQEQQAKIDEYAKRIEEQEKLVKDKEDLATHNQVIQQSVIPLLRDNADKYEVLLAQYGNQAAVEVYKNVWQIYQETGTARSFEEVANEMEAFWSEQVETGINAAAKLNKFKNKFNATDPLNSNVEKQVQQQPEVKKSNVAPTLTNNQQVSGNAKVNPYKGMTKEERVAAIVKKFS